MPSKRMVNAMSNKKFPKLAVLSLLGILSLASCSSSSSEIYAKPSNYNDPVVTIKDDDEKIHNDILSIIYDSMHDGSVASEVLDKVLYKYAESIFGVYNSVTAKGEDVITLQQAATDTSKIDNFIRKHKAYWLYDENGKHVDEQGHEITGDNWTPSETERSNVKARWDNIETRICETMYSKATTSSSNVDHFFKESDFIKSLYKDGKKVDYAHASTEATTPKLVDYQLEEKDVFSANGLLTREYYQSEGFTYIEDEVIPQIYNDLLIEQYLLDEEVASVRNSRARKINVIKIEKYSSFTNNADLLVKDLVKAIYADVPTGTHVRTVTSSADTTVDSIESHYKKLFDQYATINKGLYSEISADPELAAIVSRLQEEGSDIYEVATSSAASGSINYYKNTAYGDLIKDYDKFLSQTDYEHLDMDLYNKFTASGTITKEQGLDQAILDIDQNETITKGWFIESTKPSLDSAGVINERLFKLSVADSKHEVGGEDDPSGVDGQLIANELTELESLDRFELDGSTWKLRDAPSKNEKKYLCTINGAYFLRFEGQYSKDDPFNDIVYDDGNAYYIVNVLEAVKDNKLRASGNYSYAKLRGTKFLNEVIDEISKKVAETGSYASLSKEYWLEKMDVKYHDQKVYDYFKENYPDLFD